MQQKVTRAAALTSQATGLSIAIHTAAAVAAMEVLDIVKAVGVEPDRWIFVHAQHEPNTDLLVAVARRGAWISLDGIGPSTVDAHCIPLLKLLDAGFERQCSCPTSLAGIGSSKNLAARRTRSLTSWASSYR
jgi:predicted metal-dependent phosphotriesterase family hydrolase